VTRAIYQNNTEGGNGNYDDRGDSVNTPTEQIISLKPIYWLSKFCCWVSPSAVMAAARER